MAIRNWQSARIIFIWILTVLIFLIFAATVDDVEYPTRILLLGLWMFSTLIAAVITWIWLSNPNRHDELN